jgi:tetratricopeptide (TPR) repeat protein
MRLDLLLLSFGATVAFSLATWLEPWFQNWAGSRAQSANVLQVALGDSRKLFARHFYVKADAYFHNGYYPSIYDTRPAADKLHMAAGSSAGHDHHEDGCEFLGKPKDWIDGFSRHFYPTQHRHLGDGRADPAHQHAPGEKCEHEPTESGGEERELLPWLRLSANLDSERPETYLVASYWLRSRLGKVNEAEQFLREGLRANPGNGEILLELGRIYFENRNDPARARNVWELALRRWQERESGKPDADLFVSGQILGHLAKLEEREKNYAKALAHLKALQTVSPYKASLQEWIDDLSRKLARP